MKLYEIASKDFDQAKFEKDCAFYLEQIGTRAKSLRMFRGMADGATMNAIRPFRIRTGTVSMPENVHKMLNEFFKKKFDHPFRNGLFATGSRATAGSYGEGDPKVIVPVGKFDWLTCTEIHDIYGEYYSMKDEYGPAKASDEIMEYVQRSHWTHNKDLPGCIGHGKEIMLWCPDGYYVFDAGEFLPDAIS